MPVVATYKLSELDGFLDKHLGELQNSRVVRHNLRRSSDLKTYTSPRYGNWNVGRGVTIFINKIPVVTDANKYVMQATREELTYYDADGNVKKVAFSINKSGAITFDVPLKVEDEVEADFSFRMADRDALHQELYHGLLTVQEMLYKTFDPACLPAVVINMVISAAHMHFFESMNTEASLLYDYKTQEQSHSKSQVGEAMRANIKAMEESLRQSARRVLWAIGNGRARSVISVKQRYVSSPSLQGYRGANQDGV